MLIRRKVALVRDFSNIPPSAAHIFDKRMMSAALSKWTNRVIELKLREIEMGQRHTAALIT